MKTFDQFMTEATEDPSEKAERLSRKQRKKIR